MTTSLENQQFELILLNILIPKYTTDFNIPKNNLEIIKIYLSLFSEKFFIKVNIIDAFFCFKKLNIHLKIFQ
jgi:hypothetical protein